jgi:hypothetical protein
MRSWTIKLAAACALLFAFASALAQEAERERTTCTARRAISISVRELALHPNVYVGRCVSVRGLWTNRMLYADEDAYYRAPL